MDTTIDKVARVNRLRKNMTVEEACKKAGISSPTYYNVRSKMNNRSTGFKRKAGKVEGGGELLETTNLNTLPANVGLELGHITVTTVTGSPRSVAEFMRIQ
jgi:hypothetical protein